MKIGVLSDTHGLLREEVISALNGCNAILHGGDINCQDILDELNKIAPVIVVRGNNDKKWAEHIPYEATGEIEGIRFFMTHQKKNFPEDISAYDLVVWGHTHRFCEKKIGNTIVLNPGCCGPRRPDQEITLAIVEKGETGSITVRKIVIPNRDKRMK